MLIAICEDNTNDRKRLNEIIQTYLGQQGIKAKVFNYDSAEKLISAIDNNTMRFDIIFLDIIMGGVNGMACARIIRKNNRVVKIVFLTSSTDYVFEGYEVSATAYLIKPINIIQFSKVMKKVVEEIENINKSSIYITYRGVSKKIAVNDICYLESENNKVNIVFAKTKEVISVYNRLDEFEQMLLSNSFIRSHKSFLVNFLYIEKYENDRFELDDGTIIPISRKNKDKVKESFFNFLNSQ